MNGLNKVMLIGTVGKDAEVKMLDGGNSVASVSIAVNESYTEKDSGERKTKTEWFRVEAWKGLATFLGQYGKKGTSFYIEGRLKTDSWEQDGATKYSTKVVAERIMFTDSKGSDTKSTATSEGASTSTAKTTVPADVNLAKKTATEQTEKYVSSEQFSADNDDDLPF